MLISLLLADSTDDLENLTQRTSFELMNMQLMEFQNIEQNHRSLIDSDYQRIFQERFRIQVRLQANRFFVSLVSHLYFWLLV